MQPQKRFAASQVIDGKPEPFVLPPPDAIRAPGIRRLQSGYCNDLGSEIATGVATVGAQFIALIAVVGWCIGTWVGADETIRGDLEQGLTISVVATGLGALVGWGAGYALARNNQVPENVVPLWELGGATLGAGSTIAVALSALGIRMLLNPPALQEPVRRDAERPKRRQRPKPRSR
jgi:4-amino-4-deoxy-L-arabinose transferase-like glycosyltransferase